MTGLPRRVAAEMLGTALLVTGVVGSGIMAQRLTPDAGLALLANSLATGALLAVLILVLAPVSGAHFNPAVSLVMLLRRRLRPRMAAAYVLAQTGGGILGTILAQAMFGLPLIALSHHARTGGAQWLAEALASFGLLTVIVGGERAAPRWVAALVALYIVAAYWFTASTSFANPAVTLARCLTDSFAGIRPLDVPGFVLAQLTGALAGGLAAQWLCASSEEFP